MQTSVGDVLVAVNPFKPMPALYSDQVAQTYRDTHNASTPPLPHIFRMSDRAYNAVLRDSHSQVCVISGESGAGKTESAKLFLRHVIMLAGGATDAGRADSIEAKIHLVNPILEAFGNAATVMNRNSSRFGKFMELKLSATGQVRGAFLTHYLLEKSRVVQQNDGEANYHVFEYLVHGLSDNQRRRLHLRSEQFSYLGGAGSIHSAPAESWKEVVRSLERVGFSTSRRDDVQSVLAAILHLGEVAFTPGNNDGALMKNQAHLQSFAELVCVDPAELQHALMVTVSEIMGERFEKPAKASLCYASRDATAKAM